MKLGMKGNIFLRTVSTVPIEVFVSWRTGDRVYNRMERITAAADTVIAAPPAEDLWISIRNDDPTTSHAVEVAFDAGKAQAFVLFARTLDAGDIIVFTGSEWIVYKSTGVVATT